MDDRGLWLPESAAGGRRTRDGLLTIWRRGPDGEPQYGERQLTPAEAANLRAEIVVPPGWPLETVVHDLADFRDDLAGYRLFVHGTAIVADRRFRDPGGRPTALLTLDGGAQLHIPPDGSALAQELLIVVDHDGHGIIALSRTPELQALIAAGRPARNWPLIALSMRLVYRDSPIYAERYWHPVIGRRERRGGRGQPRDPDDVTRAERSFAIFDDLAGLRSNGGAPKKPRSKKIDDLAAAGLRWLRAHPDDAVEDVGRDELAEATHRGPKGLDEHMRVNRIVNDDVHRRMHELLATPGRAE